MGPLARRDSAAAGAPVRLRRPVSSATGCLYDALHRGTGSLRITLQVESGGTGGRVQTSAANRSRQFRASRRIKVQHRDE
jgi:hypothetical protein